MEPINVSGAVIKSWCAMATNIFQKPNQMFLQWSDEETWKVLQTTKERTSEGDLLASYAPVLSQFASNTKQIHDNGTHLLIPCYNSAFSSME